MKFKIEINQNNLYNITIIKSKTKISLFNISTNGDNLNHFYIDEVLKDYILSKFEYMQIFKYNYLEFNCKKLKNSIYYKFDVINKKK